MHKEQSIFNFATDCKVVASVSGYHCAPLAHKTLHTDAQGCLRASLGIYSKPWEVERLLKETERLLRSAQ